MWASNLSTGLGHAATLTAYRSFMYQKGFLDGYTLQAYQEPEAVEPYYPWPDMRHRTNRRTQIPEDM